ncbi:MAG: hypothetical protein IPN89_18570 [Saprospiraceae bacterium]|nr:hypothetical protein [Saprospiraceae bacterium]
MATFTVGNNVVLPSTHDFDNKCPLRSVQWQHKSKCEFSREAMHTWSNGATSERYQQSSSKGTNNVTVTGGNGCRDDISYHHQ